MMTVDTKLEFRRKVLQFSIGFVHFERLVCKDIHSIQEQERKIRNPLSLYKFKRKKEALLRSSYSLLDGHFCWYEPDSSFLELLFRKFFLQIFYFFQIVPISLMFYDDKRSEVTKAEQKLRRKLDIPHVI